MAAPIPLRKRYRPFNDSRIDGMSGQSDFTLWIIVSVFSAICLLILGLLAWFMLSRNALDRPVPKKSAPQSQRDMIWTVAPILAFALVMIPVLRLLYLRNTTPAADLTITVTGHMWYWTYKYSD